MQTRTLIVLAALVAGMSVTSLLLLLLEPNPVAPPPGGVLMGIPDVLDERQLANIEAAPRQWQAILIHDSGAQRGSAESVGQLHDKLGRDGLGYHFVVNNGSGEPDGTIEIGYRWKYQLEGGYLDATANPEQAAAWHEHVIGVCVIGNPDNEPLTDAQVESLVWLIDALQETFDVPGEAVVIDAGSQGVPRFPFEARLRRELDAR